MSRPVRSCRQSSYPQSSPNKPLKTAKKREFADISNTKKTNHNNDIRTYFNPVQTEKQQTHPSPSVFKKPKLVNNNSSSHVNQIDNEIMVSQVSASQQERIDGVAMMRKIKKVLESDFKNVHQRLQLDPIPMCLYNLKHCIKNHSETRIITMENQYLAKQMLIGNQYFQFISFIRNMCGRSEQPDSSIMLGILELILRVGEDKNCLPFNQTLIELESVFLSIFHTFPPCHLRNYYLKMFKSQFKIEGGLNSYDSKGVLSVVLNLLNDNIYCDNEKDLQTTPKNKIDDDTLNNFYLWEKEHEDVLTFNSFDRSDRFHRIFVVLDLLLKVMESDLSIFMIKYSSRLSSSLSSETRSPLIASVVWQNFDDIHINNSTIKLIINIYVNMVALNYPSDKIQIISRLINLLATVLNLHEYPDETFEYPIYKQLTMNIVREIKKTLENSVYFNYNVFINVIDHLRSPLLKMLLSNELLLNFETCSSSISLQNVYNLVRNSSFLSYKESKNNKELVIKMKYPVFDKKHKIKKRSMNQKDYLKLLKLYTESTVNYYRINDGIKELHVSNTVENSTKNKSIPIQNVYNFDDIAEGVKNVDYNEEFIPRGVNLNFKKLIHIKFNKDACLFYREQIKNLLLINKVITQCSIVYAGKFDDWMIFVNKLEKN